MAHVPFPVKRRNLFALLTVFYAALIFFFSSRSVPPTLVRWPDTLLHFGEYALLGFLLSGWLTDGFRRPFTPVLWVVVTILGGLYGAGDEFHQSFVPLRDASLKDVAVDFLGSACFPSLLLFSPFRRSRGSL